MDDQRLFNGGEGEGRSEVLGRGGGEGSLLEFRVCNLDGEGGTGGKRWWTNGWEGATVVSRDSCYGIRKKGISFSLPAKSMEAGEYGFLWKREKKRILKS